MGTQQARPSAEELAWLKRQHFTLEQAAARYGVHPKTFGSWIRDQGVKWRHRGYHRVPYGDRRVTLAEGAKLAGLPPKVVYSRWERGIRGADLWAPVTRSHSRQPPEDYELDLEGKDWDLVLDVYRNLIDEYGGDRSKAKRATARKFGIPCGAVGAAERGEWWRLG